MTVRRVLRRPASGDDGSVTVEAALGIASLVVVLALAAAGAGAALTQIRLVDAAREAARVAAMSGISEGEVSGRAAAPTGTTVEVREAGGYVTATMRVPAAGLPGVELEGRAVARVEPGAVP